MQQFILESDLEETDSYIERKMKHTVSPIIGIIFISLLFGLYGLVYLIDGILPKPLEIKDEQKDYSDAFITERAQHDLKMLTDIGDRVVGSPENEIQAVNFLRNQIIMIQNQTHINQRLEMETQTVSGSYYLDFKPDGSINAYSNVQNIIVKLYSKNNSNHSLLINAHFDSVATSPGGSDDGINCAVMLEVLRKLSRSPEQPKHNIIFLFNGAEETPLQASHGFITQHHWAKEVGVVVNLEAAGAGGKEILFQAGPGQPWLLNYYKKVPHPNGQAAGEDLFKSGLIPSGTDFRIFRDFGNMIGLDFAFSRDGYRYHTKFDGFSNIPLGSYQHVGDNALFLIKSLANADELEDPQGQHTENIVFYDFLGLFMISYSQTITIVINIIICIISICESSLDFGLRFFYCNFAYMGWTFGAILLGWVSSIIFVIVIALIIDAVNFSMSWYNNPWIVLGLYAVPTFTCSSGVIVLLNHFWRDKTSFNYSEKTQIQEHLIRLIWTVCLLIGTICGLRGVYIILIPLLFQSLTAIIIKISCLQHSIRKWQIIYVLGTIIPTIFLMKQAREILALIIPVCGRIGNDKNAELLVAVLTAGLTILITSYYIPLITLVRKPQWLLAGLCGVFLIFFVIVFTPLGFPYSGDPKSPAPQRFWIYHTNRILRNDTNYVYHEDSGFFLLNMDRNSPYSVKKYVKDINNIKSIEEDCKKILFCGFPITTSRMIPIISTSSWIPAEKPNLPQPINLKLNSKMKITNIVTRFNFTAFGPNHMALYVSPRTNVKLISTNLVPKLPLKPTMWNERPIYIIRYTWAKEYAPLVFSLDLETSLNWTGPMFDIAVTGIYMFDKVNNKTLHYQEFLNEFPEWTDVIAWLGTYESWVY